MMCCLEASQAVLLQPADTACDVTPIGYSDRGSESGWQCDSDGDSDSAIDSDGDGGWQWQWLYR